MSTQQPEGVATINPATGAVIACYAIDDAAQVEALVKEADGGFKAWGLRRNGYCWRIRNCLFVLGANGPAESSSHGLKEVAAAPEWAFWQAT